MTFFWCLLHFSREHKLFLSLDLHPRRNYLYTRGTCLPVMHSSSKQEESSFFSMGKIWVEVCLISARGLQRPLSLWKRQWYAVGWVDPNSKYCTKLDASSGNANPVWRTKFAFQLHDHSEQSLQDLALNVQVFSRDPIFLTEKLHGSATIFLKEFLAKHVNDSQAPLPAKGNEEVGSYQLRGKKSGKPQGFIDISIRVYEEKEEPNMFHGNEGGILLLDPGSEQPHLQQQQQVPIASFHGPEIQNQPSIPYSHPKPFPASYYNPYMGGPSYQPPPGPPPSHVGHTPTFIPRTEYSYMNLPSSSSGAAPPGSSHRGGVPAGFAVGAGAGALAAGAVMFGDDIMSGFRVPQGLGDPSITIVTDPLF